MFVIIIFFMFVVAYLTQSVISFINKPKIPFVTIQNGSIDLPQIYDAVIIRDEKTYTAPAAGAVSYSVGELDRVKVGTVVCSIRDEKAAAALEDDISKLDASIFDMQKRRTDISLYSKDIERYNDRIKKYVNDNVYNFIEPDISRLYALKENITQTVNIRNQMLLTENRGSVKSLVDQKAMYETELSKNVAILTAGESGIVTSLVDGLEETFTVENMVSISKEKTRMQVDPNKMIGKKSVDKDDGVFKIVRSNQWYVAAYLPESAVLTYVEDKAVTIYIKRNDSYEPLNVFVDKLIKNKDDYLVVFRCLKNMTDYIDLRTVKIKTVEGVYVGYKIPNAAVVDKTFLKIPKRFVTEGDNPKILKRGAESDETVYIAVRDSDEDYVYAVQDFVNIKVGDTIANPQSKSETVQITDIVSLKGVYMINNGIAEFKRITYDGKIAEGNGYTVLSPELNKNLRIYDRIVSDAKNISEGQKIY